MAGAPDARTPPHPAPSLPPLPLAHALAARPAGPDIVLVLAANKADLERNRQVSQEEAEAYAGSIGAQLFSTSAKANKGVEPAFTAIAKSARPGPGRGPLPRRGAAAALCARGAELTRGPARVARGRAGGGEGERRGRVDAVVGEAARGGAHRGRRRAAKTAAAEQLLLIAAGASSSTSSTRRHQEEEEWRPRWGKPSCSASDVLRITTIASGGSLPRSLLARQRRRRRRWPPLRRVGACGWCRRRDEVVVKRRCRAAAGAGRRVLHLLSLPASAARLPLCGVAAGSAAAAAGEVLLSPAAECLSVKPKQPNTRASACPRENAALPLARSPRVHR